jgi:hypothetical protein
MKLQEQIKRVLREETNLLNSALRRVSFTDEDVIYFLKKFSLKFLIHINDEDLLMTKVCSFTAYELIEPGLLHMSDEDADNAVKEMSKKLKDKYIGFIEDYTNDLISVDDNETYCFRKHNDRNMDMLKDRGFGDCVKGWVNFMGQYGSWFPDLDWVEIKEKISSNPKKYLLIKNPLENHMYEYYFSVLKNS